MDLWHGGYMPNTRTPYLALNTNFLWVPAVRYPSEACCNKDNVLKRNQYQPGQKIL
jgi:hypothetical protein